MSSASKRRKKERKRKKREEKSRRGVRLVEESYEEALNVVKL